MFKDFVWGFRGHEGNGSYCHATGGDATQMQQAIMATLFNGRTDRNDPATEYGSSTKIGGKSYYTIYLDGAAFGGGTDSNAVCIFEYGFGTGWYY